MKRLPAIPAWILCVLGPVLAAPQLLAQTGSISASPNPCTIAAGKSTCRTTLSWSASGTSGLLVRVSHNGRTSTVVSSSGRSGSTSPSWIQAAPAHTYTFYLYDYAGRVQGTLLDSVTVTGKAPPKPKPPTISSFSASPSIIDKGKSSTLSWSTSNATSVFISPGSGTVSASGSRKVSPSSTTTYTLTATNSVKSVKATAKVTVRRPPTVSGTISASPNPCTIAAGKSTCRTTLSWSASGTSGLLVRVSHNGRASTVVSSSGRSGSTSPSWIQAAPAHTYTFYLYDYAGRVQGSLLDSVTVTGKAPPKPKPPTISSFRASPATIDSGGSSTLSWSTANADSLSISPGVGTVTGTSVSVSPSSTTTYTLTAANAVKSVTATAKVTVRGPPAPTISFFITLPTRIDQGKSSTLKWSTANATSVSIDQGIGAVSTRGSLSVSPSSTTTYTLTAANAVKSVEAKVTVTVLGPRISFFIPIPSRIDQGKSATLKWSTSNADTLSISPDIGPDIGKVTGTSLSVSPSSTTTYTLTAANAVKSVTATATVTVKGTKPAPTISSFTASPATIDSGGRSTLRWSTANADTLSINPGKGTLTDAERRIYARVGLRVSPSSTTTYTLTAANAVKSVTATVTVTVGPPRVSGIISSASPNPCAIEEGKSTCTSTIQWTVKNTTLARVYVSTNGGAATLFATATGDGSRDATGIKGAPNTYVFSLYDYTGDVRGALLGSVTVTGRRVPTVGFFRASPTSIDEGKSATLSWSTANADTLFISPGIGTVTGTSVSVSPTSTTTYTLNATNAVRSVKVKVTVTVRKTKAPTISSFTADPTTIDKGQSATLRWSTTDAATLSISPGVGTLTDTERWIYSIRPLRVSPSETTTYTLTAANAVKSVTATVTVTVREPPTISGTISVSPDPCTIYHGQRGCIPTVSWESKGASAVQVWYSLNDDWEQHLASSGGGGPYSKRGFPIRATDTVVFKLYDYSGGTQGTVAELAHQSVTIQTDIGCPPAAD